MSTEELEALLNRVATRSAEKAVERMAGSVDSCHAPPPKRPGWLDGAIGKTIAGLIVATALGAAGLALSVRGDTATATSERQSLATAVHRIEAAVETMGKDVRGVREDVAELRGRDSSRRRAAGVRGDEP